MKLVAENHAEVKQVLATMGLPVHAVVDAELFEEPFHGRLSALHGEKSVA